MSELTNKAEIKIDGMTDGGKAVDRRIADAVTARGLFGKLKDEDAQGARFRLKIQGQLDGNPPRDPAKMKQLGLGGFSNVNFREAEGAIEMNGSSFWELDMEVPTFISVRVYDDRKLAIPDERDYGGIIADEYTRTIDEWPEYYYNRMLSIMEMLRYGHGPVFWRDEWSWKFEAGKVGIVLFPSDTKSLIKEPELLMVRDTMRVGELFRLIETDEDKAASEDVGWNVAEVKDAILRAQKNRLSPEKRMQVNEWEAMQQLIKNNDYTANYVTCNAVQVVHVLIREVGSPRKITHCIICEDEDRKIFMYEKKGKYDSMYQAWNPFLAGVGDGYMRSVKGLGHKTYPHFEQSNRYLNHMVNTGYLAGSLLVTSNTPNALSMTQFGPVTMLPRHVEPLASNFNPNMGYLAQVRQVLQGVINNNTGTFNRSGGTERGGPPRTAHEVNIEEIKNARLEKTQVNVHYLQLDSLHREVFRRLTNPDYPEWADGYEQAREFVGRCVARGVPKEFLLPGRCRVRAMRAIGHGSATEQTRITGELLGISDRFPVIGQNNALRDFVAARVGQGQVDRYAPVVTMRDVPNSETSVAALENNAIVMGMETIVGADQPHPIHVPIHMNLMGQIVEAYMQGEQTGQVDVIKTHQILSRGVEHIGEHMEFWGRNPSRQGEYKQFVEGLKQIGQVIKRLEPQVRQAMQEQQQQQQQQMEAQSQQMSPDMQVRMRKVEEDAAIKRENMLRQNQVRVEKAEHSMQLAEAKTSAEIARKGAIGS